MTFESKVNVILKKKQVGMIRKHHNHNHTLQTNSQGPGRVLMDIGILDKYLNGWGILL